MNKTVATLLPVFILIASAVRSTAQTDVPVTHLVVDTQDGVRVQVSIDHHVIKRGSDIIVKCVVTNNSQKLITWLDSKEGIDSKVVDLGLIKVFSPFQYVEDHYPVTYKYFPVLPGRTLIRRIRIPAKIYLEDKKYTFEDATIQLAFTYILGGKPRDCDDITWPRPCLYAVSKVARTIGIGMLQIDIQENVKRKRQ